MRLRCRKKAPSNPPLALVHTKLLVTSALVVCLLLLGFVNVSLRVIRGLVLVLVSRSLVMLIMSYLLRLLPMPSWSTFGVAGLFRPRLP